jgi:hypothetical protein
VKTGGADADVATHITAIKDDQEIAFVAGKSNQQTAISIQPRNSNSVINERFTGYGKSQTKMVVTRTFIISSVYSATSVFQGFVSHR